MLKFYSFTLLFLFFINTVSALQISEVMYDPVGDGDDYNEWIEIYNNETFDVSLENTALCNSTILPGFINRSDDKNVYLNETFILPQKAFAVITDGPSSGTDAYSNYSILGYAFHVDSAGLCGQLSNTKTTEINITKDDWLLDQIIYIPNSKIKKNNSVSRNELGNQIFFLESIPTPGYENNFSLSLQNDSADDSQENDSGECDWKTEIIPDKEMFGEDDKFAFKIKASKISGGKTNLTGEARLINPDGLVIRRYSLFEDYEATYSKTVTITNSEVAGDIKIATTLATSCEDIDEDNNLHETYVYVDRKEDFSTKEREERRTPLFDQKSRLEIDGSDDKADLFFYRGNTSKYAVYVTLISDGKKSKSTIHLKDKFSEYEMSMPFEKCTANNTIILEGLGEKEEKAFYKENLCIEETISDDAELKNQISPRNSSMNQSNNASRPDAIANNKITGNAIENSVNQSREEFDNKKIALIILLLISTALNALFIWKR